MGIALSFCYVSGAPVSPFSNPDNARPAFQQEEKLAIRTCAILTSWHSSIQMQTENETSLDIPEYTYLTRHGIFNPAKLVMDSMRNFPDLIHPAKPLSTIPRCPLGKKSGVSTPTFHEMISTAASFHAQTPPSWDPLAPK